MSLLLSLLVLLGPVQPPTGQVILSAIPAPSLKGNLLGDETKQPIAIYLPPSYSQGQHRYPVVYFLPGFGNEIKLFLEGAYQGFKLQETLDRLIREGAVREMVVVIVNGRNSLGGSFFVNSPVTGAWEDFVVKDVVSYVDSSCRTLAEARSRSLCGHSMGGFAALNLAMRHPDVFGFTYALSPGLFAQDGLSHTPMLARPDAIRKYLAMESFLVPLSREAARASYDSLLIDLVRKQEWDAFFPLAYGSAFAPAPKKNPPYIDYPYHRAQDSLVLDSTAWKVWERGFGDIPNRIKIHRRDLLSLRAIAVEYGKRDEEPWIPQGCRFFSEQLHQAKIPHVLETFDGGHEDKLGQRLAEHALPFLSQHMVFEFKTGADQKNDRHD